LHESADEARRLLSSNRDKLDKMAKKLEEKEILDEREIEELIGPPANRMKPSENGHARVFAPGADGADDTESETAH
jgi:hypothetical protein